jgi:phosphoserine aminotransferase
VIHNFNSGPSILPKEVFEKASHAILISIILVFLFLKLDIEPPLFQEVMDEARALVRELMHLDNDHEVLFLHGGATTQFMQVPMNMLNENDIASYAGDRNLE